MNTYKRKFSLSWITFLMVAVSLFTGGYSGAAHQNSEKIRSTGIINRLDNGESTVNVIVLLKEYRKYEGRIAAENSAAMKESRSDIRTRQNNVLHRISPQHFKVRHQFENILGFSGSSTREGLLSLASMPEVASIEEDGVAEAVLSQGMALMNAETTRSFYGGTGVSVAIVDTGVDYTHAMLGNGPFPNSKVIGGYDFGDIDTDPLDCNGHGTSVAGIAAGTLASGPGDYRGGVAHNAKIYALKIVPGCSGSTFFSTIAAAWDWAVTHKYDDPDNPILIINTSFSGGQLFSVCDTTFPSLETAAQNAVANGITIFNSSGNDASSDAIGAPSCVSSAVSVGAVYDADIGSQVFAVCNDFSTAPDQVTCYSNSAYFLDILAPSHNAFTTAVGGGYSSSFGGTSASSPYAAGAAAILQSYTWSAAGFLLRPDQLKAVMVNSGDPVTDQRNALTKPRVNVGHAATLDLAPDIKANSSDGPVTVQQPQALRISISLDAGVLTGNTADWWALADTPLGWFYYDINAGAWLSGQLVTYQGPLSPLTPLEIYNDFGLPKGPYTVYFGVDLLMNGSLDTGVITYDAVDITIN